MKVFKKISFLGLLIPSLSSFSELLAVEIDTTSNEVFDLYFFGNGEVGQTGENLYGIKDPITGLDYKEITGWMDWTSTGTYPSGSYWTDERKQAMISAVNAWTEIIQNSYDTSENRKLRIGFFLDDASNSASLMDGGMTGYASYASMTTDPTPTDIANSYSVAEWIWRDGKSAHVTLPASSPSGVYWNNNLLPSGENCIEIAIVLNPERMVFSGSTVTIEDISSEDLKRVAMHEIGHAMGVDSRIYGAGGVQTDLVSTWDSLMFLDENQKVITLSEDGKYAYAYESFDALCAAGWSLYQTWYNSGKGGEILLRLKNDAGESVDLFISARNIEGNSLVHLLGELGASDHDDVLGPSGLQSAVFSERDLAALRILGWQVVPEPAAFSLLIGLGTLGLTVTRRRRAV